MSKRGQGLGDRLLLVARQHAVVALSDAEQLLSRAAILGPSHNTGDAQGKVGTLGIDSLLLLLLNGCIILKE